MESFSFRYDINGLRGIAVLAVVLFHYKNSFLPGGFTGVDVFFVISGYLMTAIILKRLNRSQFSLYEFYKARVERIVPALLTVCITLIILGFFLFEPDTYQLIGKYCLSSLAFVSNIIFWNETGYFTLESHYNFFLHSWSLSVEWQFYIFYPIFIYLLYQTLRFNSLRFIIIFGFIASFIANFYILSISPMTAFFLLPTRIWELFAGSLAFLYPINLSLNQKKIGEITGLTIIILSFILIPPPQLWKSYFNFLPVFGGYICILCNNPKTYLNTPIIQKLGNYSYSIYLTHWPIFVYFNVLDIPQHFYIYCFLTIIAAFILHQSIEKKRNFNKIFLLIFCLILGASYYVSLDGIIKRIDQIAGLNKINFHMQYFAGNNIPEQATITHFNEKNDAGKLSFILIGDSHARQYANYLRNAHYNFITILKDGCMELSNLTINIFGDSQNLKTCHQYYRNVLKILKENPKTKVIIIHRWDIYQNYYEQNFYTTIKFNNQFIKSFSEFINENGKIRNYYLIGETFKINYNIRKCEARRLLPFFTYIYPLQCVNTIPREKIKINTVLSKIAHNNQNTHFIDPNNFLCNKQICKIINPSHQPIFSDDNHLSYFGANYVGPFIWQKIMAIEMEKKHQ